MPKMRTNSAAKKRFKITGSGKVFHRRTNRGHLNAKKSGARKRRLNLDVEIHGTVRDFVRRLLPGS